MRYFWLFFTVFLVACSHEQERILCRQQLLSEAREFTDRQTLKSPSYVSSIPQMNLLASVASDISVINTDKFPNVQLQCTQFEFLEKEKNGLGAVLFYEAKTQNNNEKNTTAQAVNAIKMNVFASFFPKRKMLEGLKDDVIKKHAILMAKEYIPLLVEDINNKDNQKLVILGSKGSVISVPKNTSATPETIEFYQQIFEIIDPEKIVKYYIYDITTVRNNTFLCIFIMNDKKLPNNEQIHLENYKNSTLSAFVKKL
jgi:hypothetical protein